jgi:hypothetical protein
MPSETICVPRDHDNPIDYLTKRGKTLAELAVAWRLKSTESVRSLRLFRNTPRYATAVLMAETFGWSSAGEVMDYWAARVQAVKEAKAS